ncbi:putative zinc finger protein [Orchesella cincta]|uniref:Putative zinc finger protein n=1 Tax=Orchesella cincta TaxID=48709 RepID=A0A1D2MJ35_ORCCI|nr:putative zinc finger protein [Orchesella cincta]
MKCGNNVFPSPNHLSKPKKAKMQENHKCLVCGKCYTNSKTLSRHMFYHTNERPFSCSKCGKASKTAAHLKLHQRVHSNYKCSKCPKKFVTSITLKQHFQIFHENKLIPKEKKCDICPKSFNSSSQLSAHKLTHTEIKNFSCLFCDHRSRSLAHLMGHLKHKHIGEKPYPCSKCSATYASSSSLKSHIQRVHRLEKRANNKCSVCSKTFSHKYELNRHLKFHNGEKPFKCLLCGKCFYFRWMLNTHILSHEKTHSCDVCQNSFATARSLKTHQQTHYERVRIKCAECPITFFNKNGLQSHVRQVHRQERPFPCDICDKSFSRRWVRDMHLTSHLNELPYKCEICGKRLKNKSGLYSHMNFHRSKVEFPCVSCPKRLTETACSSIENTYWLNRRSVDLCLCNKKVAGIRSLEIHTQLHTRERPYFCNCCNETLSSKVAVFMDAVFSKLALLLNMDTSISTQMIVQKMKATVSKSEEETTKNVKRHKCLICLKSFIQPSQLTNHTFMAHTNERPYKCKVCGWTSKTLANLKRHERLHVGGKNYSCSKCPSKFSSSSDRNKHFNQVHDNLWPCEICKRVFKNFVCVIFEHRSRTPPNLMSHISSVHTQEKPFPCTECRAEYSLSSSLKSHIIRAHRKEEWVRNKCSVCTKKFATQSGLTKHLKTHTGAKPYICSHSGCNKMFPSRGELNRHINFHGGEKKYICAVCGKGFVTTDFRIILPMPLNNIKSRTFSMLIFLRAFYIKGQLNNHVRQFHLKVRPFSCSICDRPFYRAGQRDKHLSATHLGNEKH